MVQALRDIRQIMLPSMISMICSPHEAVRIQIARFSPPKSDLVLFNGERAKNTAQGGKRKRRILHQTGKLKRPTVRVLHYLVGTKRLCDFTE